MADATSKTSSESKSGGGGNGNGGNGNNGPEMKGWLMKWTNYIKGYQRRWFVLSKGVLSYYRNQSEIKITCRGTISLHGALIHTVDSCTFVISNGGTQTFHIKAANEVERQSWVTALELAKAKAIRAMENEEEEEVVTAQVIPSQELNTVVRDLSERLENLRTCYDLIKKHGVALQRALTDLETNNDEPLASRTKIVNERATLFRITSNAMINACNDYLQAAESQGHKWSKMLQHEREQRTRLEDIVEQLAKQHTQLELAATRVQQGDSGISPRSVNSNNAVTSDEEAEFFDAEDFRTLEVEEDAVLENEQQNGEQVNPPFFVPKDANESAEEKENTQLTRFSERRNSSQEQGSSSSEAEEQKNKTTAKSALKAKIEIVPRDEDTVDRKSIISNYASNVFPSSARRQTVPKKPDHPLNLWSVMKNCIGKELSKIPMPINFNEPISMLQRLSEDYEYAELLDRAARAADVCEALTYVAAFTISTYSTTANRTGKPFNPLLGETFEFDRTDDLGWRVIAEQVSHHPPIAALHCEGRAWTCWQEFGMTSKFRGKYLQVTPIGTAYVHFPATNWKFSWHKVTTTVNNIIVGKLWVDQQGQTEIKGLGAAEGVKCVLKYIPYSYFSRDVQRRVKGVVLDKHNEAKWLIRGQWDSKVEVAPVYSTSGTTDDPIYKTGGYKVVWKRRPPPPDSEKTYNFTILACQLNEPEPGVAPTDSRLRPDQRLMEIGKWDESNKEKIRLEEKQRMSRRMRETEAEQAAEHGRPIPPYSPVWFERKQVDGTEDFMHMYNGKYWKHKENQDWSQCPDIF